MIFNRNKLFTHRPFKPKELVLKESLCAVVWGKKNLLSDDIELKFHDRTSFYILFYIFLSCIQVEKNIYKKTEGGRNVSKEKYFTHYIATFDPSVSYVFLLSSFPTFFISHSLSFYRQ